MQAFKLDITKKGVVPLLYAKQRDVGAKIEITITDNDETYDLANMSFSVWYSGKSGEGNYTTIDDKSAFTVSGNVVVVELIMQMLNLPGEHLMCLVMNGKDGSQIGLWNIPYYVEAIPGADSTVAQQYYQTFLAVQKIAETAAEAAELSKNFANAAAQNAEEAAQRAEYAANNAGDKKPKDVIVTATFDTVVSDTVSTGTADISSYDIANGIRAGKTYILYDDEGRKYEYSFDLRNPNQNNANFRNTTVMADSIIYRVISIDIEGRAGRNVTTSYLKAPSLVVTLSEDGEYADYSANEIYERWQSGQTIWLNTNYGANFPLIHINEAAATFGAYWDGCEFRTHIVYEDNRVEMDNDHFITRDDVPTELHVVYGVEMEDGNLAINEDFDDLLALIKHQTPTPIFLMIRYMDGSTDQICNNIRANEDGTYIDFNDQYGFRKGNNVLTVH